MKIKILQVLIILQIVIGAVYGQTISEAEYFVDTDPGVGNGIAITITPGDSIAKDFSFSVGDLSPGWHRLSVRVKDDLGRWNVLFGKRFFVYDTNHYDLSKIRSPLAKAEYFFDEDPGQGNGTPIPLIRGDTSEVNRYIQAESLDTGYHYLYIRAMNDQGLWGLHIRKQLHIDTTSCTMPVVDYTYDTVTFGTPTTFTNLSANTTGGTLFKWDINNDDIIDYTTENITHSFAEAGVYEVKLTVENDTECLASIIKGVVVGPLPDTNILITGLTEFCAGDSVILASNNDPGNHTYSWSNGKTSQEITVKSAGIYYVWTTNSYGMAMKSMAVSVEVRDTLDLQLTKTDAADGNSNGMAFIEISGGSGNYSISWSTGSTLAIVNDLPAGSYSVTVDDGTCPKTIPFTIYNLSVNPGNLFIAEYFIDDDPGVGNGISLNIGAGDLIEYATQIPLTGIPTGYHVLYIRVRNTDGNWSIASRSPFFVVDESNISPPPSQPQLVEAEYFLDIDPGVGNGIPFIITPGDFVSLDPTFPTDDLPLGYHAIFVRVKDELGKWSIYNGKPFHIYNGEYTDLQKTRRNVAIAEYFFDEDPGVGNGNPISFNIYDTVEINRFIPVAELDTGNHVVYMRVMDEDKSWSLWQSEAFHVHHVTCTCPTVDFTADTVNVLGNTTTFANISVDVDPAATYEWDVDDDDIVDYTTENITHTYIDYGIYDAKLTIFNSDSCYAAFIKEVVVSPALDTSIIIVGNLAFCEGDSVILTAQSGYEYNWSNGKMTQSLIVKEAGSYNVRLTNQYGVQGMSQTIDVAVYPTPEIQLTLIHASGGNANGSAILDVSGGSGSYTYDWSTGGTLSIENNLVEGDYNILVSDGYCPASQDFHIYDNPLYPGDVIAAEYFYDEDPGTGNATPLNIAGGDSVYFATFISTAGLSLGYHDLSIRVKNDVNKWSIVHGETVFIIDTVLYPPRIEAPLVNAEYFFDEDPGAGNGIAFPITKADSLDENLQINTLGLEFGYHNVSIRVKDSLSVWSIIDQQDFFVYESDFNPVLIENYKIVEAEYFYDTDPGVGNGTPIEFSPTADSIEMERYFPVSGLQPGPHRLFVRSRDESGKWSIYDYHPFDVVEASCTCPIVEFSSDLVDPGMATSFTDLSDSTYAWTTYEWDVFNDGSIDFTTQNMSYNFGSSGIYDVKLTVSNSDTCQASIIHQTVVGPLPNPIVTIQGNTEFCTGDSVTLTASSGLNYKWWPEGETSQSIVVKTSGTYYVWVTTASGIELKSNTLEITEHNVPEFMLTTIHATDGNSNGSAFVEVTGGTDDYSYLWSTGGNEFYVNNLSSGNYSVEINDGYCPVDSSFFIDNLPVYPGDILAAEYFFNEDPGVGNGITLNIAAGDSIEMVAGISVAGLPVGYNQFCIRTMDTDFRWSIFHEERIHVYDATEHNIQVSQPPLAAAEFFLDIDLHNSLDPGVGLGAPIAITPGDLVIDDFNYEVDTLSLGYHNVFVRAMDDQGKWSVFEPSVFHIYDTTFYDLTKDQPDIVAAEYFFDDDPGIGNGIELPITPGDSIEWNGGLNLNALSLGPHKFSIRSMDAEMKWSIVKSKDFAIYDCTQPLADFTFTQVCLEDTVHFTDLSTEVDPAAIYEWDIDNDGTVDYTASPGNLSHKYNVPGTYEVKLKITHNVACSDSIIQTVDFPYVNLGNDTLIYTDQNIVLDAGSGFSSYLWSDGSTNQTLTVYGATGEGLYSYHVTVANGLGCTDQDTINISIAIPPRDLVIINELVNPILVEAGSETTASCEVHNTGDSLAIASTLNYYLSTDTNLSQNDVYLSFSIVGSLEGGTFESKSNLLTIPPLTIPGTHYILFLADADSVVHESDKDNNLAWYEIEVVSSLGIELQLKAFFEGPYDTQTGATIFNNLVGLSAFPLNQPYNISPWNYYGTESIASIPNTDIVDWIIVELRETPLTAISAIPSTVIDRKAGFLLKDGSIVGSDGINNLIFDVVINDNLYVVISHRNHVDIMSANPLTLNGGVYDYDFSTGANQVHGDLSGHVHLGAGVYGMAAGDGNADGDVNLSDKDNIWKAQSGQKGYLMSDFSMDSESNNIDKNDMWLPNNGIGSQVPE